MADNLDIKDGNNALAKLETKDIGGNVHRPMHGVPDGADVAQGALANVPATSAEGSFSIIALVKRLIQRMAPTIEWAYVAASGGIVNSTTPITLKTAAGAGLRNYISSIQIRTAATTMTASDIVIKSGSTELLRSHVHNNLVTQAIVFATPLKGGVNEALTFTVETATGASGGTYVNAQGFVGP